ncbi:MAG: molybdopterin-dependent oxidoreductase, partial [Acidobacteria bacterium]|nr:molybdopterin-dependent oxidoreductase [Acidobacteriota bacterium]
ENATTREGTVVLPAGIFPEVDGTVVNYQGRVQVMHAAYPPPFLARTGAWILARLAFRLDAGSEDARPRDLFDELAAQVPAFRGLTYANLGASGCVLPGAARETPAAGAAG